MPSDSTLDIAVVRGVITEAQANSIRLIEAEDNPHAASGFAYDQNHADEEGFKFASGFADIFIALGIGMLLYGILQTGLTESGIGILGIAAICWLLSEVVATWQRRSLPSIVCAFGFVSACVIAITQYSTGIKIENLADKLDVLFLTQDKIIWLFPLTILIASLVYYARFRLPFSAFLSALGLVGTLIATIFTTINIAYAPQYLIPSILISGLLVFVGAIYFDIRDRNRLTHLSDTAFWLHLVASPFIVHSIMWQSAIWVTSSSGFSASALADHAPTLTAIVLAIFLALMVIALIINRRAMLVSSLIYVTLAIGYLGTQTGGFAATASFVPIILGIGIISIGIGWSSLRRIVFAVLPLSQVKPYLSPVT